MATKSSNKNLHKASQAKKDEFYTQLVDIENELKHYKEQFKGKVVYCNCDDPFESNFFKYFAANFNALKLKKLITTSFVKSPIVGGQLPLFDMEGLKPDSKDLPAPRPGDFCVYVLKCADDSFYIGQTDNYERRLKEHNNGKGAQWTKNHLPFEPIHWEIFNTREEAVKREKDLKTGFGRKWLKREYAKGRLVVSTARQAGPFKIEINEVKDLDADGAIDLGDVKYLLEHDKNVSAPLKGNGDFRSDECVALLKQADIVVTNPPFSLFREYVAQLVEHEKKFLIIGSLNAITYKEIFKLIKENKIWLAYGFSGGNAYFQTPYPREFAKGVYNEETGLVKFRNVTWFTNLETEKRHEDLILYKKYTAEEYPKYDNYDAINIDKTRDIPMDYKGAMGVPISFLDKYNPEQFEIIKFRKGDDDKDLVINGKSPFFRILIKHKKVKK